MARCHLIDPAELRADRFERSYEARKAALLSLDSSAMGKALAPISESVAEDPAEEDDEEEAPEGA